MDIWAISQAAVTSAVTSGAKYMVDPAIREGLSFFCPNKVITDLKNEKKELTSGRDSMLKDVENLLKEVEDLEQRMNTYNDCFHGLCPTFKRYCLCKQMAKKTELLKQFKAKSNILPFSHIAPLPGIQYLSSENFTFFESTKVAYSQLLEALRNDGIYMIGVCGTGGSGKTTLVTEVGKEVEKLNLFDKVILVTVSQTPNILNIQEKMASMLSLELKEKNEEARAQRLWLCLKEKKRILIIVDDLWRKFELKDIGIRFDNDSKGRWKVLLTTRRKDVCSSMDGQKIIDLGLLSNDESWTLFQKHAKIDDAFSKSLNDVPRELCDECNRLPLIIVAVGSSLKRKRKDEWELSLHNLRHPEQIDDHVEEVRNAFTCLKLSYDYLGTEEAKLLFLMCSMFLEDYEIDIEALIRYAVGLGLGGGFSLDLARCRIQTGINKLLDSCLLMHVESWENHVKMHDMVRDVALWIAKRSEDHKIMVNIDKSLNTLAEDDYVRDYFALCSWYQEDQISLQFHAPNLEILLLHGGCKDSLNLSHATFKEMEGLKVLSLINDLMYNPPSLALPQSTQLLTNLQTLRLNEWELGDISFIESLTSLEVLDLKGCTLNELPSEIGKLKKLKLLDLSGCHIEEEIYNGAIGKCSQLEELYLAACSDEYIYQSVVDFLTLPKLQRFVIHTNCFEPSTSRFICEGKTRVLELVHCNISTLKASKSKLLHIAEIVGFNTLYGRCENIIPYIIGGMNDLNSLCLVHCEEVECVIDTTSDSNDVFIPKLVELQLEKLDNLNELCRGPPLHVLRFFQKLEKLRMQRCPLLQSIFPWQCNLGNLKILIIQACNSGEVLFSMSVAQSLQHLEDLRISWCKELKHIIASERKDGSNPSKEVVSAPTNSHFVMMPALKKVLIGDCEKLESIFPICCVEGLARLEEIEIYGVPELKYVFGECDHEDHSSHQYDNHKMLPHLDVVKLDDLENLIGICPENYRAKWPSQRELTVKDCPKLSISWIAVMAGTEQRQQHLNERVILSEDQRRHLPSKLQELSLRFIPQLTLISWVGSTPRQILSLQCLQELKVIGCDNMKSLFSMQVHRSLPELMSLYIELCPELEQIIEENEEELEHLSSGQVFFPKLTHITITSCDELKSLFSAAFVRMLPQLSSLHISCATQLEEVFRHSSVDGTINEIEVVLPNLTELTLLELPSFVDICQGFKLQALKLQNLSIYGCPKTAPSLREIEAGGGEDNELEEEDDDDELEEEEDDDDELEEEEDDELEEGEDDELEEEAYEDSSSD